MSKYDYLHALYRHLLELDASTRSKIMRDVENMFRQAEDRGETEISLTNRLGKPAEFAKILLQKDWTSPENSDVSEAVYHDIKKFEKEVERIMVGSKFKPSLRIEDQPIFKENTQPPKVSVKTETSQTFASPMEATHYNDTPKKEIKKIYTSPQQVNQYQKANHPVAIIFLSLAMLLFNAIFAIGPFVTIWALVIAFSAVGFALALAGLGVILSGLLSIPMSFISVPIVLLSHPVLLLCFGFLLLGIGGLLTIGMIYSIRIFGILTYKYLSWNIRLIRGF